MKNNFYISAIYTSPSNSMGGNTKIMLEIVDNLCDRYNFIIFTTEPETFKNNLKNYKKIKVISIDYPFNKFSYLKHMQEVKYVSEIYEDYFKMNKINHEDFFLTPSDFAPDVLPVYNLRKKYKFTWIASLFLFIPSPYENIKNKYGFPFFKYIIYFIYQKYIFSKILKLGDKFLITNDYDRKYFPKKLRNKIFAIYGGVNPEQIEKAKKEWNGKKIYDAVFCSRLHPQKGISGILDIWKMVLEKKPESRLVVIGNGEKTYEAFLKQKAKYLGIDKSIKWMGYVNGVEKYKIYLQSKIFLHGTIYDNNGMVAAEALCSGIPVIMYDLQQLKKIYSKDCIKIDIGNNKQYSNIIGDLLTKSKQKELYIDDKARKDFLMLWSWDFRIKEFTEYFKLNNSNIKTTL